MRSLYRQYDKSPELAHLFARYLGTTESGNGNGDTHKPLTETDFNACINLLKSAKLFDNLPKTTLDCAEIELPSYHIVKLPMSDVRAFILGKITKCCQSINGHACVCVIDGWTSPNAGFYVLLRENNNNVKTAPYRSDGSINYSDYHIVGQSYAWRSLLGNLVFNAWIFLKMEIEKIDTRKLLETFSKKIISDEKKQVHRVMLGSNIHVPATSKGIIGEQETVFNIRPYGDSIHQVEIASLSKINGDEWRAQINAQLASLNLTDDEKNILIKNAIESSEYPRLLFACSKIPILLTQLKSILQSPSYLQTQSLKQMTEKFVRNNLQQLIDNNLPFTVYIESLLDEHPGLDIAICIPFFKNLRNHNIDLGDYEFSHTGLPPGELFPQLCDAIDRLSANNITPTAAIVEHFIQGGGVKYWADHFTQMVNAFKKINIDPPLNLLLSVHMSITDTRLQHLLILAKHNYLPNEAIVFLTQEGDLEHIEALWKGILLLIDHKIELTPEQLMSLYKMTGEMAYEVCFTLFRLTDWAALDCDTNTSIQNIFSSPKNATQIADKVIFQRRMPGIEMVTPERKADEYHVKIDVDVTAHPEYEHVVTILANLVEMEIFEFAASQVIKTLELLASFEKDERVLPDSISVTDLFINLSKLPKLCEGCFLPSNDISAQKLFLLRAIKAVNNLAAAGFAAKEIDDILTRPNFDFS
ncbi:MAG: hypothetical protein NTU49_06600, partial [Gammaproteobacteria bacterium]|nr:hypothetical protein [Gammaproteobacteria bacterium]